jgi:cell wall-associated NlpC family hydrolase
VLILVGLFAVLPVLAQEGKPKSKTKSSATAKATPRPKKTGTATPKKATPKAATKPGGKATPAAKATPKSSSTSTPAPESSAAAPEKPTPPAEEEEVEIIGRGAQKKQTSTASEKKSTPAQKISVPPKSTTEAPLKKAPEPPPPMNEDILAPLPKPAPPSDSAAPPATAPPPTTPTPAKDQPATNASIEPEQLVEFSDQPAPVQQLLRSALALTKRGLTYTYGSADPANGGMDCSGAIYYVLREHGLNDVPRDASGQYVWARKNGQFFAVVGKKADSFEFSDLLPGDLLFWSGTYSVDRDPPVTHSMIYLGTEKPSGRRVMFGSSDGRSYEGKARWGVSVFDFKMPRTEGAKATKADFLGYARIPGLRASAN